MISAGEFFTAILHRDGIPECRSDEHGAVSVFCVPFDERGPVRYPVSFLVQLKKQGESVVYYYNVEKKTRRDSWHFTRAWEQQDGKWVAELSLPK